MTLVICLLGMAGLGIVLYPFAAQWASSYNQSLITGDYNLEVVAGNPSADDQLALAEAYNSRLSAGAELVPLANVASGTGTSTEVQDTYWEQLTTFSGTMSRLQIPKIDVDLPIYHGTSDAVLLEGAGHLQGTSLPVGGVSTHSVLTGHRGLAGAKMFTDLDQLAEGDTFTLTTFGRVMTYQVTQTQVVDPDDTASLRQQEGKDLVTLITCTPLGINTQRILVTAERVTPTLPESEEIAMATGHAEFPWWLVAGLIGCGVIVWYAVARIRALTRKPAVESASGTAPAHNSDSRRARRLAAQRQGARPHRKARGDRSAARDGTGGTG
ncbi:class C sortase [Microbacterium sp. ZW T5_56]|uniref:class C sortase n=1 Tax=Microbacterium sp. ZW T5_56 TaxID=3378081 RepID=UPI0038551623